MAARTEQLLIRLSNTERAALREVAAAMRRTETDALRQLVYEKAAELPKQEQPHAKSQP